MKRKEEHLNIEVDENEENVSFLQNKEDYQCVICFDLLCEPVVIPECGHTCCKTCLKQWFANVPHDQPVNCPAGCKAKIKRVVPATCVFIQNEIESRFPTAYAARKKEIQGIKIPGRLSHLLKASPESREFRVYLNEVKDSKFWNFLRWWRHFLIFIFACTSVLMYKALVDPQTNEGFDLKELLMADGVSETSAQLFENKSARFFLKLNNEDLGELGVSSEDIELMDVTHKQLESELAVNSDFWLWREDNMFFVTMMCITADWMPRTALLVFGVYVNIPMFLDFIQFQLSWWNFALYGTLCLCLPEGIWYLFWLPFAHKSPWFTFFVIIEMLNTFCNNWKQWNLKQFQIYGQSFATFSAIYLLPSFLFNGLFYVWLVLPSCIYVVEIAFPVWVTLYPELLDHLN